MDDRRCTEDSIPRLPPGIKTGLLADRYNSKRKQWPSHENKCQGNVVHLQNQLCNNVDLNTLCNFKNNCGSVEANQVNFTSSDSHSNYYHKLFTSGFDLGNLTPNNYKIAQAHATGHKSRRDKMKARAETRRDVLINESSDEDYSSINSSCDSRLASHKHSINMDDAYSRKSRAARTERYYRRLSREDSFRDNDNFRAKYDSHNKIHDNGIYAWKPQMQSFAFPITSHIRERCSNLSFNHNHSFVDNPIYRSTRTDTPTSYNKHFITEKNNDNFHMHRRESNGGSAYAANMNYNRFRRSDPGNDAILAYKKDRSSHVPDRSQQNKPKTIDYQPSLQIAQPKKPSVNPTRHVKRSYSFQSEIPKKYDTANNVSLTMHRMPLTDGVREGSNNLRNERKWIDLVSSTPNFSAGYSEPDFKQRPIYLPKERDDFTASDTNLTKASDLSSHDSNPTNLSLTVKDNTTTVQRRSSKNLEKELSELEKLYNSLRLSDDNLLDRAEERCMEEFSQKGQLQTLSNNDKHLSESSSSESISEDGTLEEKSTQQSSETAHVINDDMAYRKMQSNKMPALSETQNSLSQISYLLASSALILDNKTEYPDFMDKVTKEEPNITKDDMVYRNLHYANNVLKVVEPQPPFGIPLRPATPSTNSNYLCSTPVALKSPPLKYVPQSEPNLITDDLAFRNLRKDAPKSPPSVIDNPNEVNIFLFKNDLDKSLSDDKFCKKKKKAVRSLSANLYGLIKDVHNLELNVE